MFDAFEQSTNCSDGRLIPRPSGGFEFCVRFSRDKTSVSLPVDLEKSGELTPSQWQSLCFLEKDWSELQPVIEDGLKDFCIRSIIELNLSESFFWWNMLKPEFFLVPSVKDSRRHWHMFFKFFPLAGNVKVEVVDGALHSVKLVDVFPEVFGKNFTAPPML